ncbi:MAG: CPBP family intramembrane metalloprotease [Anaerolineaceae bacterium]|nr:MAG: CPBP family intramembrane metalloprotease [Anaerolineaceae bacterium]
MKNFLKRHSLIIGIALMFLYTWTIDLSNSGVLPFQVPFAVALTVGWGFIFVSLLMTWLTLGKEETAKLFKRFFLWRVNWKWWMVALFLSPALQFASVLLTSWRARVPADFSHPMIRDILPLDTPLLALVVPWILFEVLTNGEEMGWRGYILPRLQVKYSALVSSLILGVVWSIWHLPKFFGTGLNGDQSFLWYTLFCLAAAVLYTWLYNNTRGSLLLATLLHAAQNTAGMFLPVQFAIPGGIEQNILIMLYVVAAIVVTVASGAARLSRTEEKQAQD